MVFYQLSGANLSGFTSELNPPSYLSALRTTTHIHAHKHREKNLALSTVAAACRMYSAFSAKRVCAVCQTCFNFVPLLSPPPPSPLSGSQKSNCHINVCACVCVCMHVTHASRSAHRIRINSGHVRCRRPSSQANWQIATEYPQVKVHTDCTQRLAARLGMVSVWA